MTQIDVECEGRRTTTPILMGPATGPVPLGATTLEELGLGIDPLNSSPSTCTCPEPPVDQIAATSIRRPPRMSEAATASVMRTKQTR